MRKIDGCVSYKKITRLLIILVSIISLSGCASLSRRDGFEDQQTKNPPVQESGDDEDDAEDEIPVNDEDEVKVEPTEAPAETLPEETEKPVETEEPKGEPEVPEVIDRELGEGSDGSTPFDDSKDSSGLSKTGIAWSFKRNSEHKPTVGYNQGVPLEEYGAYYRVDTQEKVIYLTFDEGYENGYTPMILDILKENNVHATFFVTESYIKSNPDLCIRMKEEGHLVANHSSTHPNFSKLTDEEIKKELESTANKLKELTGYDMDPFFRPPAGDFSEYALYNIRKNGYRTIFWSLAYADWDPKNQPGTEYAYNHMMQNYHPGAIFLLHAVSESSTQALDSVIKDLKAGGYRFGSLYEVE